MMSAELLTGVGEFLFRVAELGCAACVDPNQAMGTGAAAAGAAGAAAAAAGAAGMTDRERSDEAVRRARERIRAIGSSISSDVSPAPNAPPPYGPGNPFRGQPGQAPPLIRLSRQIQRWAEYWVGKDQSGTTVSAGKA